MVNQLKSDYYVYCLYDNIGAVKYIGSGRDDRKDIISKRKQNFKDILKENGRVEEVCSNLNRVEAIKIENELLSLYRNQIINVNKKVRLLDYKYEYFDSILELDDNSPTGLIWKIDASRKMRKGSVAGTLSNGYFSVKTKSGSFQIHRLLYCLRNKVDLEHHQIINHIDFNPSNNSPDNLEVVSMQMNCIKKNGYNSDEVGIRSRKTGFESRIIFNGFTYTKMFKSLEHGVLGCKEEAMKFRKIMVEIITSDCIDTEKQLLNVGAVKSKSRNIIGGVRYRPGKRNCFEAYGTMNGVLKTKHFSINKYGFDKAKRLAEEARKEFVLSNLNQVEKDFNN